MLEADAVTPGLLTRLDGTSKSPLHSLFILYTELHRTFSQNLCSKLKSFLCVHLSVLTFSFINDLL